MSQKIYEKDILINRKKYSIFINLNCWFFELNNLKIARSCQLYLTEEDMLTITSKSIDITLYHRVYEKQYFYLILIKSNLFVVERTEFSLKMVCNLKNTLKIKIEDRLNTGKAEVFIERETGEKTLNDILKSRKSFIENENEADSCFDQNRDIISNINTHTIISQKIFERINVDLKFGPNCIRSLTLDEKAPLIKYGDVWTKTSNEKIVIVVSLLNCTYGRPITLQNINVVVDCIHQDDFDCSYELFNLQQTTSDSPSISKNKKYYITPETEAILILTTNNSNLNCLRASCLSNLFISYEIIKNDETYCQQLFLEKISLNRNLCCNDDDDQKTSNTSINLKEFLLLTANSFKTQLQLPDDFSKDDLIKFLMTKLKFLIKTILSSTDHEEVLIKENGYWKNTLISFKPDQISIYSRTKYYAEELIQTIYAEFAQRCTLKPIMFAITSGSLLGEFKNCLKNEIIFSLESDLSKQSNEFKTNRFLNELNTDVAYLNIM